MQVLSLVGQPDCNGILGCSALYLFSTSGPHQEALRRENVESGTGTWPQQPFCRPSAAFAAKSMQPSPVGQAQAGASSSGSPLTDRFRGDFVSWQLTALKSSEHFFNVFIEQQKYVLFVSLSLTRPVTADRMVIPSPSHVPCLHSTHQPSTAVACLRQKESTHSHAHTHPGLSCADPNAVSVLSGGWMPERLPRDSTRTWVSACSTAGGRTSSARRSRPWAPTE